MNATSSWEKQARALEDAVTVRPAPEAALPEYLRALDTVRRETMAAQPDDYLRQEAGILFELSYNLSNGQSRLFLFSE